MRARQLRTVDRESADDRLTSATEKTTPALSEYSTIESPDGRLERLQRRRQREGQTEHCPWFQLCQKKNVFFYRRSRKTFVCMRQAVYSTSRDLPSMKLLW